MEENKMPSEKELLLSYLDTVFTKEFAKLVGKLLKRIEILDDKEYLKKEIKELIYESSREMRDIFLAYSAGLEVSYFSFVKKTIESKEK
jgi:hypothetical protein